MLKTEHTIGSNSNNHKSFMVKEKEYFVADFLIGNNTKQAQDQDYNQNYQGTSERLRY